MLSKEASSIIFWVFGMTQPGIEPWSSGPWVNTLPTRPMSWSSFFIFSFISNYHNYYYYCYFHMRFNGQFFTGLIDVKVPKVTRTLQSILADLNNAVVWMVSTHPLISNSSSLFLSHLETIPSASPTTVITITIMFDSFFSSSKIQVFVRLFVFFNFCFVKLYQMTSSFLFVN